MPSKYIKKCYDLKGSTVDRKVLKEDPKINIHDDMKMTLKDMDFLKIEKQIYIESEF